MVERKTKTNFSLLGFLEKRASFVMTAPAVTFMAIMIIFPIGFTLYIMFFRWSGGAANPPKFIGLNNFLNLFKDARFSNALVVTLYITAAGLLLQTVLGTAIALLLNESFVGRKIIRAFLLLPMMATWVATALVWRWMMYPKLGVLNFFLEKVGLPRLLWLSGNATVVPSIIMIDTWQWTPLIIVIVLAGLQSLPREPYESAKIDGAHGWQILFRITLPMVRPVIVTAMVLRTVDLIKTFDVIMSASQGGPRFRSENLNIYIYNTGLFYFRIGYSGALLLVYFLIILGVTYFLSRQRGEISF
jgi:multiple sugar transport system permease protein